MIPRRTTLVLGAGASSEYGFPVDRGLRDIVCGLAQARTAEAIVEFGHDPRELSAFVEALRYSAYGSVDWFLEDHPEYIGVGKRAIAAALIPFEQPAKLFPPAAPSNHWYELLVNLLYSTRGEFNGSPLSVVTFNYDRSLEYYLLRVLEARTGDRMLAGAALDKLEIVHVHGSLGGPRPSLNGARPYEPDATPEAVGIAAEQIVVVGEASPETPQFRRARALLTAAERIVFLGFGFHEKSVQRLGVFEEPWDEEHRRRVTVDGTNSGITTSAWFHIKEKVLNGAWWLTLNIGEPEGHDVFYYLHEAVPLDRSEWSTKGGN